MEQLLPDFLRIQPRAEGTIVRDGISVTETMAAFYIYVQARGKRVVIRQPKSEDNKFSIEVESLDDLKERRGTNGL